MERGPPCSRPFGMATKDSSDVGLFVEDVSDSENPFAHLFSSAERRLSPGYSVGAVLALCFLF